MVDQPFTNSHQAGQVYVNDIRESGGYGLTETAINLLVGSPDYLCIWLTLETNKLHITSEWCLVAESFSFFLGTLKMASKGKI